VTKSGAEVIAKGVTEVTYPTIVATSSVVQSSSSNASPENTSTILANCFQTRETGMILQVVPELSDGGRMIHLTINPQLVEDPVWHDFGPIEVDKNGKAKPTQMQQPFFHVFSTSTSVSLDNGHRVMVGGGMPSRDHKRGLSFCNCDARGHKRRGNRDAGRQGRAVHSARRQHRSVKVGTALRRPPQRRSTERAPYLPDVQLANGWIFQGRARAPHAPVFSFFCGGSGGSALPTNYPILTPHFRRRDADANYLFLTPLLRRSFFAKSGRKTAKNKASKPGSWNCGERCATKARDARSRGVRNRQLEFYKVGRGRCTRRLSFFSGGSGGPALPKTATLHFPPFLSACQDFGLGRHFAT
jgi:hypothetical protein